LRTWTKAEGYVRRIVATLGTVELGKLHVEQVVTWQSQVLKTLAPRTVGHYRQTLAEVMGQAVELSLIAPNPVRRVRAPRVPRTTRAPKALIRGARSLPRLAVSLMARSWPCWSSKAGE
jgi:hypothetical protein